MHSTPKGKCNLTLTIQQQLVPDQGLLEGRAHKCITSAGLCQDSKVDPEKE